MRLLRALSLYLLMLVGLFSCGTESFEDESSALGQDLSCLNCNSDAQVDAPDELTWAPRVDISPAELMFYPDSLESEECEPKEAVVTNLTGHLVFVTQAYAIDVGDDAEENYASEYFSVEPLKEYVKLQPNEATSLWVTFLGSSRQRSGTLVVHTTDEEYFMLEVPLTGKLFVGN